MPRDTHLGGSPFFLHKIQILTFQMVKNTIPKNSHFDRNSMNKIEISIKDKNYTSTTVCETTRETKNEYSARMPLYPIRY